MTTFAQQNLGVKPSGFILQIDRFPELVFSVQSVNIPAVDIGVAKFSNSQNDVTIPGDKIVYQPLQIRLMLDDKFDNYLKLYGWLRKLGFATFKGDYASAQQRFAQTNGNMGFEYAQMSLIALNAKNNPIVKFNFVDAFPSSMGSLDWSSSVEGEQYLFFDMQFTYSYFSVDLASLS